MREGEREESTRCLLRLGVVPLTTTGISDEEYGADDEGGKG